MAKKTYQIVVEGVVSATHIVDADDIVKYLQKYLGGIGNVFFGKILYSFKVWPGRCRKV